MIIAVDKGDFWDGFPALTICSEFSELHMIYDNDMIGYMINTIPITETCKNTSYMFQTMMLDQRLHLAIQRTNEKV